MTERVPCAKCGRTIDRWARICPYCNWSQDVPVPAAAAEVALNRSTDEYVPPPDTRWKKPVFAVVGGILLLFTAFVVGMKVHGKNPPEAETKQPAPVAEPAAQPSANVRLVPDNSTGPLPGEPITSAPVDSPEATDYNRADATAASSEEYAEMAKRAQAEQKKMATLVDPRTISGIAGMPQVAPRRPVLRQRLPVEEPEALVARTAAIPEYQPMPDIRVRQSVTARLELRVSPDGHVEEVNIIEPIPGDTARLVSAVQRWRFRPATHNGRPVASSFTTAISFHADD